MDATTRQTEALILLLTQHQDQLFRYIFALLPNEADARDAMQETSLALYRKFEQYDEDKPFLPWAYRFAYLEVLKQRSRSQRQPLSFSEDVLELLADERQNLEPHLENRLRALDGCLQKLPAEERQLVTYRYDQRRPVEEIMEHLGQSRRTLFRNLERVRRLLHDCVTQHLEVAS
ncbi:MAG: sigma-70 family RNA polymerase sigma factor [Prosthecobacter sp.]|nr:sigma-70 family RNA polymerase sigma factor [Prosthecobacter sp.]